jgi:hypothetical protein
MTTATTLEFTESRFEGLAQVSNFPNCTVKINT